MAKKKLGGLGKGLDSLFAELPDISDEPSSSTLPLREIEPDPCLLYTSPSPRDTR